jgi:radical SAM superfamily enzyme YgiQ (UPF0313 family)
VPHVAFVPFTGFRVREEELLSLGMSLPGLQQRAAAIAELPALGLLTLAGMLPPRWTCSYRGAPAVSDELVQSIASERPTLVAVSALTASIEEAYAFSRRLRAENIPIVLGGLHATTCPDEARRHCDAVVVGEGEAVWDEVLRDAEAGRLRPVYTSLNGSPHGTWPRRSGTRMASLGETRPRDGNPWPLPRFDLLPGAPRYTLQTQRGCPLACEFCAASRLLGPFREKPTEHIRAELAEISLLAPEPLVELADDNTFAGHRDFDALLDVLAASGVRYFTEADWRLGERPELVARLAESGCVQVLMGIESLVFRYPGMGGKRAELERIMDAVETIQAAGVAVNGCFILGADGETHASIDRLVRFILASPLADVQVTLQTPFPGTSLRQRLGRAGRLLDRSWSAYTLFDVTFQPDCLGVPELEQAFRHVLRSVYCEAATRRRQAVRRDVWRRNARLRGAQLRGDETPPPAEARR